MQTNAMNVHNKKSTIQETQYADKVNAMNVHNKKSTTRGNTTSRQSKRNECT